MQNFGGKQGALWCLWKWWIPYLPFSLTSSSLLLAPYSCKASCKRTQHCWLTTPNIVGCYMLRPFAHPVACCWMLLRVVAQILKPVKLFTQQLPTFLLFCMGGSRIFFRRGCTRLLRYFNTIKPHSFFCRIPVVLETAGHLRGRGVRTPCTLPLDPLLFCDRWSVGQQCWIRLHGSSNTAGATHAHYAWITKTYGLYSCHDALQVLNLLGVVASVSTPLPTRTHQLPTLLRPFARSLSDGHSSHRHDHVTIFTPFITFAVAFFKGNKSKFHVHEKVWRNALFLRCWIR